MDIQVKLSRILCSSIIWYDSPLPSGAPSTDYLINVAFFNSLILSVAAFISDASISCLSVISIKKSHIILAKISLTSSPSSQMLVFWLCFVSLLYIRIYGSNSASLYILGSWIGSWIYFFSISIFLMSDTDNIFISTPFIPVCYLRSTIVISIPP